MANKKISQFDAVTAMAADDYLGGYRGSVNKRFLSQQVAEYANGYGFYSLEFDNSDLTSYTLTVTHDGNSRQIEAWVYDNNWVKQSLDGLLTLDSVNQFSINFGSDITGTHTLYYKIY